MHTSIQSIRDILPLHKPKYRRLSTTNDFYTVFQKVERKFDTCFLLESLGPETQDSRYSIIGFDPRYVISARGNTLRINDHEEQCDNPYGTLRELMPDHLLSRNYASGLVGYMSYEAINYLDPSLRVKIHPLFDQFMFGMYLDGLVLDKMTSEITYFCYDTDRFELIHSIIGEDAPCDTNKTHVIVKGDTVTPAQHRKAVEEVQAEIRAGNVFQCEVGFKTEYEITGSKLPLYSRLREINPSPHMYYLKFGDRVILGSSPELLLRVRGKEMETFPLAGTIKRGRTPEEDLALAHALLNNPKEQAEHQMLVDLHRNDLGRVARFGTVAVRRFMEIKKFSHVQHISSEIAGVMRRDADAFSALASVFPAGTLTGAPKHEAMKIIDRLEPEGRGPYGGAVGHFGFNGDCTFAIPIRTLFVSGTYAYTQTCGGIVYDSDPEKEYQEILHKRAALDAVINSFI